MIGKWLVVVGLAVVVILVLRCTGSRGLSPEDSAAIDAWTVCIECTEGELRAVLAIPDTDEVAARLTKLSREGPDSANAARVTALARQQFTRDSSFAADRGRAVAALGYDDRPGYVATYASRYDTAIRDRAAMALGCLLGEHGLARLRDSRGRLPPLSTNTAAWLTKLDSTAVPAAELAAMCR